MAATRRPPLAATLSFPFDGNIYEGENYYQTHKIKVSHILFFLQSLHSRVNITLSTGRSIGRQPAPIQISDIPSFSDSFFFCLLSPIFQWAQKVKHSLVAFSTYFFLLFLFFWVFFCLWSWSMATHPLPTPTQGENFFSFSVQAEATGAFFLANISCLPDSQSRFMTMIALFFFLSTRRCRGRGGREAAPMGPNHRIRPDQVLFRVFSC